MTDMIYEVRVDIYEEDHDYPIVVHIFYGDSPEEAHRYHDAHRKSDKFLRECEDGRLYAGSVKCRVLMTEGWQEIFP